MDKFTWNGKCPTWAEFLKESQINEVSTKLAYNALKKGQEENPGYFSNMDYYHEIIDRGKNGTEIYHGKDKYGNDIVLKGFYSPQAGAVYTVISTASNQKVTEVRFKDGEVSVEYPMRGELPATVINNIELLNSIADDLKQVYPDAGFKNWKDVMKSVAHGNYSEKEEDDDILA